MNQRLERINQMIRDEIADMLRRDLHDPLIGFVTITEVDTSPDLRHAKVFFSVLGDTKQVQDSIKGLLRARKYLNARLAERIELRYIPKIRFVYDETAAKAQEMAETLRREQEELGAKLAEHEAAEAAAAAAAAEAGETPAPGAEGEDEFEDDELLEGEEDDDLLDDEEDDLEDDDEDFEEDEDLEDEDFDEDETDEAEEER